MPLQVSAASSNTSYSFGTGMLGLGSSGSRVATLQKALRAAGFNAGPADGKFGPMTLAALRAFQKAAKITIDGRAGPQTFGALKSWLGAKPAANAPAPAANGGGGGDRPTLKIGARGDAVKRVQLLLHSKGINAGPVDGVFGPTTHAAVSKFQKQRGLGGSGLVGPKTWAALWGSGGGQAPAVTPPTTGGAPSGKIASMLSWAKSMIGSKYAAVNPFRFGEVLWDGKPHTSVNGSGTVYNFPKGTRVFDCSGFVVAAFRKLGVDLAAKGLFSTSTFHANSQGFLQNVPRSDLKPGDLVMYKPTNGIGHVVIYMGNGQVIEARGGKGVVTGQLDESKIKSIRRVPL